MKRVVIALIVGLALSSHAKIGESPELIEKRYGKAVETRQRNDGMEDKKYSFENYTIRVTFRDGKAVQEIINPKDTTFIFTDDECMELAKKVTGLNAQDWVKADGANNLRRRWDSKGFVMA